MLKHKDSFGKSKNLSIMFFAEILVFDHDYEGKSSSSNGNDNETNNNNNNFI